MIYDIMSSAAGKIIKEALPRFHAVTLIRSGIGRPYRQKRTLKALGLTKMHKTVVHKNTPSVNGMLASVSELINIRPIRTEDELSMARSGRFLDPNSKEWAMRLLYDGKDTSDASGSPPTSVS